MADATVETRMDALRRRLLKAVKVDGIATYKELSEALNQNPTFVQQFVTKRSPKRLFDEQIETITQILDSREAPKAEPPSPDKEAETQLRSALLAFGVDAKLLPRAIAVIRSGFLTAGASQEQTPLDDQPPPASRPHGSEPSRSKSALRTS